MNPMSSLISFSRRILLWIILATLAPLAVAAESDAKPEAGAVNAESFERGRIIRQRCSPENPIELGVIFAIVERQAEMVLRALVKIHLLAPCSGRPKIQAEDAIPGGVVFLAPGVGLVEREPVMIAAVRFLHPARRELLGDLGKLRRLRVIVVT